jgi:hypothetical protein
MSRSVTGTKGTVYIHTVSRSITIPAKPGVVVATGNRGIDNAIARRIVGPSNK